MDNIENNAPKFYEPTENDKELLRFVVDHTTRWRDYRDQNYQDDWDKYERVFRSVWAGEDKHRESEPSRGNTPATQQAVETRHAEEMGGVFGEAECFTNK